MASCTSMTWATICNMGTYIQVLPLQYSHSIRAWQVIRKLICYEIWNWAVRMDSFWLIYHINLVLQTSISFYSSLRTAATLQAATMRFSLLMLSSLLVVSALSWFPLLQPTPSGTLFNLSSLSDLRNSESWSLSPPPSLSPTLHEVGRPT